MSTQTAQPYLKLSPNMPLTDIAKINDLSRRALALFYCEALDPANPVAVALACSVDVAEAGTWGRNVNVRLAELKDQKPKRKRSTKHYRAPPELRPNLFMAFDDEQAMLTAAPDADTTPGEHDPAPTTSSCGVEK
ncbi:MAG: hypothetical protein ACTHM2_15875 [Afipia sp.]